MQQAMSLLKACACHDSPRWHERMAQVLAQSLTTAQDEEVQKVFEGLEQQLLQKEADQLPAAPTVRSFCTGPSLPACCGVRSVASLQCLLAASHCLAKPWEGSDAQHVRPGPLEQQLLHTGAGKLPTYRST